MQATSVPTSDYYLTQTGVFQLRGKTYRIPKDFNPLALFVNTLELEPALAALAAAQLQPYSDVPVMPVAFEDWSIKREAFGLVLSAQSFHWVEPALGLAHAAVTLRLQGAIALVWHLDRSKHTAFYQATQLFYEPSCPRGATRACRSAGAAGAALSRCLGPIVVVCRGNNYSLLLAAPIHRFTIPQAAASDP